MENRLFKPWNILLDSLDGIKRRRQKSKNNTVRLHHTFCYISLPSLHDYDVSFSFFFFWCFFMNAKQQKMRADAKGATREAKRVARVTFLDRGWRFHALSESRDYSTSTLASHADFRYCHYNDSSFTILKEISYIKYTLYYVADVRLLVTLSSLSWGRNTWRNLRTKNVCAGSYSPSKYLKGSRKWNLDSFMIKISPIQTFFSNFLK